jgi:D-alanyl-D-alanine dipeptidase
MPARPDFDFSALTCPVADVVPTSALGSPAPPAPLTVPNHEPIVASEITSSSATSDPLVALVDGDGLTLTHAYHRKGWPGTHATAYARASIVPRLDRMIRALPDQFGLAIFDAWRPLALQAALHDAACADPQLPAGFVAEPCADPTAPPPHLTGATLDLTLTFDGQPLALGTGFDDFTDAAHADHFEQALPGSPESMVRDARRLLTGAMHAAGFVVLHAEWWHFEYGTRYWAAVTGHPPKFGPADLALGLT